MQHLALLLRRDTLHSWGQDSRKRRVRANSRGPAAFGCNPVYMEATTGETRQGFGTGAAPNL